MKTLNNTSFLYLILTIIGLSLTEQIVIINYEYFINGLEWREAVKEAIDDGSLYYFSVALSVSTVIVAFYSGLFEVNRRVIVFCLAPVYALLIHLCYFLSGKCLDHFYYSLQIISVSFSIIICIVVYWRLYHKDSIKIN